MKPLSELELQVRYRSSSENLVRDFYVPCMKRSCLYQRAVGFFTSTGLAVAAQGVAHLLTNGGNIQLIASPRLSEEDIAAIREGYASRESVIRDAFCRDALQIEDKIVRDRLRALAWMISKGALDVKLALRTDQNGNIQQSMYHEKIGIFSDETGNSVAFIGSSNETASGLGRNFESIDVYWTWDDPQERVPKKLGDFEHLWSNSTKGLEIIDFTEVAKEVLETFKTSIPPMIDPVESSGRKTESPKLRVPESITLRDYQETAIESWFRNNGRGTLKMATGSGKTITALSLACKLIEKAKLDAVVIVCPFRHLVTQWNREAIRFGFQPILAFETSIKWTGKLTSSLMATSGQNGQPLCVITTNATFAGDRFQRNIKHFPKRTLLIADECHNLGAKRLLSLLPEEIEWRLALSATPERWFDDSGTDALFEYFGPVLEPQFTLEDALNKGALVPYLYYPIFVELTPEEQDEYLDLSESISKLFARADKNKDIDDNVPLKSLLVKRARLIAGAKNKIQALRDLMKDRQDESHMLFYCGDGKTGNQETQEYLRHIDAVTRLLGYELGFRVSKYVAETALDDRENMRVTFDSGVLQGIVAIRCLDEGVDIPSIRTAVILASSTNPRQFIQRRGRILRRCEGKTTAQIFDMIVLPPKGGTCHEHERSLIGKELRRYVEFADLALNSGEARGKIVPLQVRFGLLGV